MLFYLLLQGPWLFFNTHSLHYGKRLQLLVISPQEQLPSLLNFGLTKDIRVRTLRCTQTLVENPSGMSCSQEFGIPIKGYLHYKSVPTPGSECAKISTATLKLIGTKQLISLVLTMRLNSLKAKTTGPATLESTK